MRTRLPFRMHPLRPLLIPHMSKVCELIEVDGLSRFVYSDGPVAPLDNAGMLEREPYPGSLRKRKLVIAELAYADADDTSKATPK